MTDFADASDRFAVAVGTQLVEHVKYNRPGQ